MMSPRRRIDVGRLKLPPASFARYVPPDLDNAAIMMLYYGCHDVLGILYSVVTVDRNRVDMPTLRNPKWERFAQELAGGKTAGQAYELAGFSPNPANAWRLHQREEVRRRINEILDQRQRAADKALANAAARAGVDEFWVLRNLRLNAVMAMRAGDRAAAARSIELIGKHLSMFIDHKQIEIAYVDDADEYLAKIIALVDAKTIEHEPALTLDHEAAEP
jgi:phage terminase small subunit